MAERAASPHPWAMATEQSVQVLCLLNETAAPVLQKHPHCSCLQQHRGHSPAWECLEQPQLMAEEHRTLCSFPKTLPHAGCTQRGLMQQVQAGPFQIFIQVSLPWARLIPQNQLHLPYENISQPGSHTSSSALMFLCSPLFILSAIDFFLIALTENSSAWEGYTHCIVICTFSSMYA